MSLLNNQTTCFVSEKPTSQEHDKWHQSLVELRDMFKAAEQTAALEMEKLQLSNQYVLNKLQDLEVSQRKVISEIKEMSKLTSKKTREELNDLYAENVACELFDASWEVNVKEEQAEYEVVKCGVQLLDESPKRNMNMLQLKSTETLVFQVFDKSIDKKIMEEQAENETVNGEVQLFDESPERNTIKSQQGLTENVVFHVSDKMLKKKTSAIQGIKQVLDRKFEIQVKFIVSSNQFGKHRDVYPSFKYLQEGVYSIILVEPGGSFYDSIGNINSKDDICVPFASNEGAGSDSFKVPDVRVIVSEVTFEQLWVYFLQTDSSIIFSFDPGGSSYQLVDVSCKHLKHDKRVCLELFMKERRNEVKTEVRVEQDSYYRGNISSLLNIHNDAHVTTLFDPGGWKSLQLMFLKLKNTTTNCWKPQDDEYLVTEIDDKLFCDGIHYEVHSFCPFWSFSLCGVI